MNEIKIDALNERKTKVVVSFGIFLLLALVFAISYSHKPLYNSNQNAYFLHGLADGGMGLLDQDWLSQTTDPYPVFSFIVKMTYRYLHESVFHFYYFILLGVYLYGILGIASHIYNINISITKFIVYFAAVNLLHSTFFDRLITDDFTYGLAGQYLLGPMLQPSVFGVFMVLSICTFLRGKPFLAVLFTGIAVTFHPSLILCAAILTLTYMIIMLKDGKDIKKVLLVGITSLLTVLPVLFYTCYFFHPDSPETLKQVQNILMDYKMPCHAKPSHWFCLQDAFRTFIMIAALYIIRKKKVFLMFFLPFLIALLLTIAQIITGSKNLALLFPWRVSVFLIPISSCILLAEIISRYFRKNEHQRLKYEKKIKSVAITVILVITLFGGIMTIRGHIKAGKAADVPMMDFVSATKQSTNMYLIPTEMLKFRLYTEAPIFVDKNSHPYKDVEVIEWYKRMQLAEKFYQLNNDYPADVLKEIMADYEITHVVIKNSQQEIESKFLHKIYRDNYFAVYKISLQKPKAN